MFCKYCMVLMKPWGEWMRCWTCGHHEKKVEEVHDSYDKKSILREQRRFNDASAITTEFAVWDVRSYQRDK